MDIDSEESYARLCANCGCHFVMHRWIDDACPIVGEYEVVGWNPDSYFEEVKDGNAS